MGKIHIGDEIDLVIYLHHFDDNSSLQKFLIVIQFIIVIKLHLSGVNLPLLEFSSVMKIGIKIYYLYENS